MDGTHAVIILSMYDQLIFLMSMMFGYTKTLDNQAKARYDQKVSVIGLKDCPYDLPADSWVNNPTKWPEVQWPDVYSYLVETPGKQILYFSGIWTGDSHT